MYLKHIGIPSPANQYYISALKYSARLRLNIHVGSCIFPPDGLKKLSASDSFSFSLLKDAHGVSTVFPTIEVKQ